MKPFILALLVFFQGTSLFSQQNKTSRFADLTAVFGSNETAISAAYFHHWSLGKQKKWEIGIAGRFTSYLGTKQEYITAPAILTSGKTGPFVIFSENIVANLDTFNVQRPQVNALNIAASVAYHISKRWETGFNIDVIGFSFGREESGVFTSNGATRFENAKPTAFNLLLTSDNDLGSLNSELYLKYKLNQQWKLKAAYQFLFTEYTANEPIQTFPEPNDRFRNKSGLLGIGVTYQFK